jgi:hypothetical protein
MAKRLFQTINSALNARANCMKNGNEFGGKWESMLYHIEREILPRGSGVDRGCRIDRDSHGDKLKIEFAFHHMDEHGFYDGWTDHVLTIRPAFDGFDMKISGRDRNGAKDYFYDMFSHVLSLEFPDDYFREFLA